MCRYINLTILNIEFSSPGDYTGYTDTFTLECAKIENYQRTAKDYTTQVIVFDVVNNWNDGNVTGL